MPLKQCLTPPRELTALAEATLADVGFTRTVLSDHSYVDITLKVLMEMVACNRAISRL